MYVICMLYVWATYNMAQSLCTRVFAPCHVIRLYVFAKFIIISYRLKGIQLPTEAHFPTDWSLFSLRLKPPFDGNASHPSLQYLLWGYSDASQGWRKPFPWGKGDIPVGLGNNPQAPRRRHLRLTEPRASQRGSAAILLYVIFMFCAKLEFTCFPNLLYYFLFRNS